MIRNVNKYIFIYIITLFVIGCSNPIQTCTDCFLEIDIPELERDSKGFYRLDFDNGSLQTFIQIRANIGKDYEYVGWATDTFFDGCTWGYCEDVPIVNGASYSGVDGYAYTMLGVYEENIGDVATIWAGYNDDYGNQWLDTIRVIIDE